MNTSQKTELTVPICHVQRFSKSGILIYNSEVPDTSGRKTRRTKRRRKKAIAKRYTFHKNAINKAQKIIVAQNSCSEKFLQIYKQHPLWSPFSIKIQASSL